MKKRLLFTFIVVYISIFAVNVLTVSAANISGSCGKNITYVLDSKGVLTISGTGDMDDFTSPPWNSNKSKIKDVKISSGVTSIGDSAFYECNNLKSITIADTVRKIGNFAFHSSGLTELTLSKNVSQIGRFAFANCKNLEKIYFKTFPYLGSNVFYNTNAVKKIYMDSVEDYISQKKPELMPYIEEIYIGQTLLTDKTLWEQYTKIPDNTFEGYNGFTEIEIPDSITCIGNSAFANCKNMEKIILPKSISSIGDNAFLTNDTLTDVLYNGDETMWNSINIGKNNNALNVRKFFAYVTVKNEEDGLNITEMYTLGETLKEKLDWKSLEEKYTKEYKLYLDADCTQECNVTAPVLRDLTVYIKLGRIIDKYYDIANATVENFNDIITPTSDNTQDVTVISLNGTTLKKDTDYVIWYYNNTLRGKAQMLIIGQGMYHGYIEKEFDIVGDTIKVPLGKDVIVHPTDSVEIINLPGGFEKIEYLIDGKLMATWKTDVICGKSYIYDEGVHEIIYHYTETEFVGPNHTKTYYVYEDTEIKSVKDTETAKIEIEQILNVGKDKVFVKPQLLPIYASNASLTWTSSDESVATVDEFGVITLHKAGKAVINAVTANGKNISVDMNIEPLKISKAVVDSIEKKDGYYEIALCDKYGTLEENKDYVIQYSAENDILTINIKGINLYSGQVTKAYNMSDMSEAIIYGDMDGDGDVSINDAIYLFNAAMFPDTYPIPSGQRTDYNNDGVFDMNDAIYLFNYVMFPDAYPI